MTRSQPTPDDIIRLVRWALRKKLGWHPALSWAEDELSVGVEAAVKALRVWDPERGAYSAFILQPVAWAVMNFRRERLWGAAGRYAMDQGEYVPRALSMDAPITEDGLTYHDLLAGRADEEPTEPSVDPRLALVLDRLSERERIMVTYPEGAAATMLGILPSSVNRQKTRIYIRLRREFGVAA